ncbi:SAM-dependent methyltransferase [Planctomycetes bacterium K23_9]|uniref:Cyclopropane-fatty-acyl-phospholipid synthase n=1 Tax=Stieleria marina TaxID=1930275 RepID=A0A517NRJ5_9BACT|nr:Cyclopropane-fatty-acyl-phospholipid synthase [Planctomycetes bacterium K23_9]
MSLIQLAEKRWLPDPVIRIGMRRLLRERLQVEEQRANGDYDEALDRFADQQRQSLVTIDTHRANEQHYEVPAEFFQLVLGPRLKYSCGWWANPQSSLEDSENLMLELTCRRAQIEDGMSILDLGCGWGSLTLWLAEHYPNSRITSLSNSKSQREFIQSRCKDLGFKNVQVLTEDVGIFDTYLRFDRVVSVEMFEHVRNHENLLRRISSWLEDHGKLFVHIFCHRNLAYAFETDGEKNWMGRHFFSGGIMPAEDLFLRYQQDLQVAQNWWINGGHYARTCENWLSNQDEQSGAVRDALGSCQSADAADVVSQRWRMFFMACAELFKFNDGNEWGVGHYLFEKPADGRS